MLGVYVEQHTVSDVCFKNAWSVQAYHIVSWSSAHDDKITKKQGSKPDLPKSRHVLNLSTKERSAMQFQLKLYKWDSVIILQSQGKIFLPILPKPLG